MSESDSSTPPARGAGEQASITPTAGSAQELRAHAVTVAQARRAHAVQAESSETTVNQTVQTGPSSPAPANASTDLQSSASSQSNLAAPQRPGAGRGTSNPRNPLPPRYPVRRGGSTRSLRMNPTPRDEADSF